MTHNTSRFDIFNRMRSRRNFLRTTAAGSFALAANVPSFLGRLCAAESNEKENDRILVVFQFSGGNDGLSTVVPYGVDDYYKARPKLAIPKQQVLPINDTIGIVKTAAPFKEMYDEGNATIIQAVGYPNPNRSHFVSMDYWHTGVNAGPVPATGWIGRALDPLTSSAGQPSMLSRPRSKSDERQTITARRSSGQQVPAVRRRLPETCARSLRSSTPTFRRAFTTSRRVASTPTSDRRTPTPA